MPPSVHPGTAGPQTPATLPQIWCPKQVGTPAVTWQQPCPLAHPGQVAGYSWPIPTRQPAFSTGGCRQHAQAPGGTVRGSVLCGPLPTTGNSCRWLALPLCSLPGLRNLLFLAFRLRCGAEPQKPHHPCGPPPRSSTPGGQLLPDGTRGG